MSVRASIRRGLLAVAARAMPGLVLGLVLAGLGTVLAVLSGCAASGRPDLPEFPPYPPADDFLAFQEELQNPRQGPPLHYTTQLENLARFRRLQARLARQQAAQERREAIRRQARVRAMQRTRAEWEAFMEERARRSRAAEALLRRREASRARRMAEAGLPPVQGR